MTAVLLRAANVLTLSGNEFEGPGGVLVRDGVIERVLPGAELGTAPGDTPVVDLGDRTLMPGFVDPHAHAEVAAKADFAMVDVRAPGCASVREVLDTLRANRGRARGGWLVAQGNLFFDQKLSDRRFPTRDELDTVSTELAIAIRAGGHLSILNSRALELAGIDESYEAVEYSVTGKPSVQRDESGRPTGIVTEMDKLLPFPRLSPGEARQAVESGIRDLFTARGVTTIGEISESLDEGLRVYDDAIADGRITARIHVYLWTPGTVTLEEACDHRNWASLRSDPALLKIQGVKAFADGGYSAARAALTQPYAHDGGHNCGEVALSTEQIVELATRTQAQGLQLAVHANGDRAQLEVCEALAGIARAPGGPRIRIEHAGNFVPDYPKLTEAWKSADIVPVPQPVFIYNFAEFLPSYVGEYARDRQFPLRRMLDDGWPISGSSDVWVGSETGQTNPFLSIASTVGRLTFHHRALNADQGVGIYEALRMHTVGGAYALGEELSRGTLEPGKLADLIALDRNPLTTPVDELTEIEVDGVFLGGVSVHRRDEVLRQTH
ncbi:periplasmic protein [Mycolicibacterium wolinskyi]|uniref:Periplasmic protein n=1 Tax=Mycolicibacterium wolinskyi TaxID=59750 RepID=A0A132PN65_9MYCO|nr:amidohydrolase family protein [Mycolicibacterium wolinskyi]KWX23779.1 periplasmic protein [Mycolicibacterium wolinskyi]